MKQTITLLAVFISISSFAQNHVHPCSASKSRQTQDKSDRLSPAQMAKTEQYNVHYYELDLQMDNLSTHVAGSVNMHAITRQAVDTVWYELFDSLHISAIRLNGAAVNYSRQGSAIKVPVNMPAGQSFIISTDYDGTPPTAAANPLGGAGMSNRSSPTWGNQVTWSLSQPFSAYEWWPCKQSLRDKADSVSVKITVPSACKAGSNGVLQQVVNLGNGKIRYEWKHRHPIDHYLVSVAVAHYVEHNLYAHPAGSPDSILIQNYIYDNPATLTNFIDDINETADFLEFFSEIYGPYPFRNEKYGHCMAPIGGGMEHQTMTTQGSFSRTLTAHELAHQWFGDHVTCGSWADIWVNEGFASYSEYLMLARLYAGEEVEQMADVHTNVMSQPGGSVWCADSLNNARIFSNRLTYDKGAAIIHSLRFQMHSDSAFFKGLRNYQAKFADSTALGTDMQAELELASGKDLGPMFEQWYFGEGYPTYSARWNMVGGDLHLKITHTTSMPSVTPTFTNDLEIKFRRTGLADTTIRFAIGGNTATYIIPNPGTVSLISAIDPNNWIVNKNGSTAKDPNLVVTGIAELEESEQPLIYPNPAQELVHIQMKKPGNYQLTVLDPKGRKVCAQSFSSATRVDFRSMPQGIYLFQVVDAKGEGKTYKLVRK